MESAQPSLNDFFTPWKVSFEKSAALWARQFETAEKIGTANVSAFKAVFDASSMAKPRENKDQAQNIFAFGTSLAQMAETATACSALMAELAGNANEELATLAIKYVNKWGDVQVEALDKMADKAPPGLELALKALGQAISSAAASQACLLESFLASGKPAERAPGKSPSRKMELPVAIEAK